MGAQPPIEMLRQWTDTGGWFERETSEFRQLVDLTIIGAMAPPGRRAAVDHAEVQETLRLRLRGALRRRKPPAHLQHRDAVVPREVLVQRERPRHVRHAGGGGRLWLRFRRDAAHAGESHYMFNLRDLSKVHQASASAPIYLCRNPRTG